MATTLRSPGAANSHLQGNQKSNREPFAVLPRWTCSLLGTWGERAVFAIIVSRHILIKKIESGELGEAHDREQIFIAYLARNAGISKKTAIEARRSLLEQRLILVNPGHTGDCRQPDSIYLNSELKISSEVLLSPRLGSVKMSLIEDDPGAVIKKPMVKKCPSGWCKNVPSTEENSYKNKLIETIDKNTTASSRAGDGFCNNFFSEKKRHLQNLTPQDLIDPLRTEAGYREAIKLGLLGGTDKDRADFYAAASYAVEKGMEPVKLFAHIVNTGSYKNIPDKYYEESAAARRKGIGGKSSEFGKALAAEQPPQNHYFPKPSRTG